MSHLKKLKLRKLLIFHVINDIVDKIVYYLNIFTMATLRFIANKVKSGELVFDDNMRKLVTMLIHSNIRIDKDDELAIFDLEDSTALVQELMKERVLSTEAQIKLFSLKNAECLISKYIEEEYLSEDAIQYIFEMPDEIGCKLFKKYIDFHPVDRYINEVARKKGWI